MPDFFVPVETAFKSTSEKENFNKLTYKSNFLSSISPFNLKHYTMGVCDKQWEGKRKYMQLTEWVMTWSPTAIK